MAKAPTKSPTAVIQYENMEALAPVYAEGAQGMLTSNGSLHVSFYSEYIKPKSRLEPQSRNAVQQDQNSLTVQFEAPDPFGLDQGNVEIVRRIETSVVITKPFLVRLIPWLQGKLDEIIRKEQGGEQNEQTH